MCMADHPVEQSSETQRQQERENLVSKLASIDDPDIRTLLEKRIADLEADETTEEPADAPTESEEEEPSEPKVLTSEEAAEVEAIVRNLQVAVMREDDPACQRLIESGLAIDPTSWRILTVQGDRLVKARKYGEAVKVYTRALRYSPRNLALERKHADAIFRSKATVSIEDQIRLAAGESLFAPPDDDLSRRKVATLLNAVLPGAGHLYLGNTAKGLWLAGAWLVCALWLLLLRTDLTATIRFIAGGNGKDINPTVILPALASLCIYIVSLVGTRGKARRQEVHHPVPPVNLPFD